MIANIDISDIQEIECNDKKKRYLLDSPSKIVCWIKYGFSKQKKKAHEKNWKMELEINLSNCVLCTESEESIEDSTFSLLEVIIEAKKDGCDFFDCDGDDHNSSHRLVKYPFKCDNSLFYWGGFQNTTFLERVSFENTTFVKAGFFSGCDFKRYLSFEEAKFLDTTEFDGSNFNYTYFNKAQFSVDSFSFLGCKFNEGVSFNNIRFSNISNEFRQVISFRNCLFNEETTFDNVRFTEECHFDSSVFDGVCSFENCSFDFQVFFNNTTINKQLIIHSIEKIIIIDSLVFSGATISGRLELLRVKTTDFIGNHISIQPEGLLRLGGCDLEEVELSYLVNKGIILLQNNDSNIKRIDLSVGANFGIIEVSSTQIECKNRVTARMLKDSAYKSNNSIDAIYYKSQEHKFYKKELNNLTKKHINILVNNYSLNTLKIIISLFIIAPTLLVVLCIGMYLYVLLGSLIAFLFIWTPIGKWIKELLYYLKPLLSVIYELPITEHVLLWLNTISNKNGQSWWRGLVFTTAAAWLFFVIINYFGTAKTQIFVWGWRNWDSFGDVWINYLNMFYLTDFKDKFYEVKLNAFGETVFFISKIFIGYGIYQTISAFRKYGK